MTDAAATLRDAVIAWDWDEDMAMSTPSRDAMHAAVVEVLGSLPGVRRVYRQTGTAGSDYYAVVPGHDDACEVEIRVSNHAAKGHHPSKAWSFEAADTLPQYEMGLAEVARQVAQEIDAAQDRETA